MTTEILDNAVYEELAETMGADFAGELITTFLSDAPNMFAELVSAVENGDADGFRRAAHSIKSNAQVFGATALSDQSREMELAGLGDSATVSALQATYDQTAIALRGLLDE